MPERLLPFPDPYFVNENSTSQRNLMGVLLNEDSSVPTPPAPGAGSSRGVMLATAFLLNSGAF